ncbi:unnamed protein product [Caenorhabditis angaria]|uniref:Translation initiation factor eIF2B subunit gamma n=1 Tax=Caenorhabditis angaria TaxID=860376 RepID=A0A9P1I9G2_9PELO|nr:unnamed protein product [Caenorhabditis angaria]
MRDLQGVLLCSGSGSRMKPLTTPKCLLPVVGVPMFLYPLSSILRAGIKDIKIFVRDTNEPILKTEVEKSGLLKQFNANIEYIKITSSHDDFGTGDLLRHYHNRFTHDLLIVSCDFVSDSSLIPFVEFFRAYEATLVALVDDNCANSPAPGPKVKKAKATDLIAMDEETGQLAYLCGDDDFDGVVGTEKFVDKFPKLSLTSKYNDCHVYAVRNSVLQSLNKNFISFKADFVPFLIESQFDENSTTSCFAYRLPHENGTVTAHANTTGAYFEVNKEILKSFNRLMPAKGNGLTFNYRTDKIAMNDSRIESTTKVGKDSVIKRSVVLNTCQIGEKVKLKESLILNNVIIGNGASITNSIICDDVEIGDNAEVINCIVTSGQKVAAKAKVQNEVVEDDDDGGWTDD